MEAAGDGVDDEDVVAVVAVEEQRGGVSVDFEVVVVIAAVNGHQGTGARDGLLVGVAVAVDVDDLAVFVDGGADGELVIPLAAVDDRRRARCRGL